ncbi:hypothetical protein CITRIK5_80069 [Citricoccus sp. K5]|uniref:Uncharacterized protein n=1 Tax=Citricoccus parietis TaxID=592307 RepID=A0ABV5G8Q2_9MICC|nr:hypothetical protein CITRIK5_80069 [Citricoccus sp. K5]
MASTLGLTPLVRLHRLGHQINQAPASMTAGLIRMPDTWPEHWSKRNEHWDAHPDRT